MRHLLTVTFAILTFNCFSQDHSTIYFLRSQLLSGKIYINNRFAANIERDETIQYNRLHTEGLKNITLETRLSRYANVDVKSGGVYYFKFHLAKQTNEADGKELIARSIRTLVIEEEPEAKKVNPPSVKIAEVRGERESTCFMANKDDLLLINYHTVKDATSIKNKGIGNDFTVS